MARKTQRRPDKIELGVVDIHTHVLPGIDDGAEKMALSYRMLRRSYKQGVRKVIATPHYATYHWRTKPADTRAYGEVGGSCQEGDARS